jgi:DNA-binding beta-propeller fold protein YncE
MRLFRMNFCQARGGLVQMGAVLAAALLVAGCGDNLRPVISPVNSNGPAAQPQSYAVVVSDTSLTAPGVATIIDYSGDSVMATAPIGEGPTAFTLDAFGSSGYTVNIDSTVTYFPISVTGSSALQANQVKYSTLPPNAQPLNLFSPANGLWAPDLYGSYADSFSGYPPLLHYSIPVALTPVMVVGPGNNSLRNFAISQNIANPTGVECNSPTTGPIGVVTPIETLTFTIDAPIPAGKCPVFAVESSDSRRLFVLNRGDDTITVINAQTGALDYPCPTTNQLGQAINCPLNGLLHLPAGSGPIYAEYSAATNQLVVANYDGGTISVIDVTEDEFGNDGPTFGTTFTIPVGNNPASVTALADLTEGSRAYTANQADQTVTIVNLSSHTVEKTLPVTGHPRTVVSTQNGTEGKVYVASPDTNVLTIIRTDQDIVDATVLIVGNIIDVRVSSQTGSSGSSANSNIVSRVPGFGQPCNLPPALMVSTYGANYTLANCSALP